MAKTAAALHILVKEEKLALDLLEQIKNGADFGKLAKKHSICPSGKRGGDLGEFRQGQMVPAFDKVVFSCPVLELSLIHISRARFPGNPLSYTDWAQAPRRPGSLLNDEEHELHLAVCRH